MKIRILALVLSSLLLAACATSPTGQRQLRLFPNAEMVRMGATAFEQIKSETPRSRNAAVVRYINCVARAVTGVASRGVNWEVQVFESPEANAFALPGGKIGVYTGLLKVAENQHQLAAVIGHEISHVTAEHGNARVSASYASQAGLQLASALAGVQSPMQQQLMGLLGLGVQYGVLMPYGRGQETEADILGQMLMARAGFDPRQAVTLWQNMARSGGPKPPAFLSTHPSSQGRIAQLNRGMPRAMATYQAARSAGRAPNCR